MLKPSISNTYVDDNLQGLADFARHQSTVHTLEQTMVFQSHVDDFWSRFYQWISGDQRAYGGEARIIIE